MMIQTLINYVKSKLYLILGIILTFYIFYSRLLVTRIPRELHLSYPYNIKLIYLIILGIITSSILIFTTLTKMLGRPLSKNLFTKISAKISEISYTAFNELFNYVSAKLMHDPYQIAAMIATYYYKLFGTIAESFFVYIKNIIRSVILLSFLIDVFYFFKLHYFYKTLYLLCIIVCINFFMHILRKVADNTDTIRSWLIVKEAIHPATKDIESAIPENKNFFQRHKTAFTVVGVVACIIGIGYLAYRWTQGDTTNIDPCVNNTRFDAANVTKVLKAFAGTIDVTTTDTDLPFLVIDWTKQCASLQNWVLTDGVNVWHHFYKVAGKLSPGAYESIGHLRTGVHIAALSFPGRDEALKAYWDYYDKIS